MLRSRDASVQCNPEPRTIAAKKLSRAEDWARDVTGRVANSFLCRKRFDAYKADGVETCLLPEEMAAYQRWSAGAAWRGFSTATAADKPPPLPPGCQDEAFADIFVPDIALTEDAEDSQADKEAGQSVLQPYGLNKFMEFPKMSFPTVEVNGFFGRTATQNPALLQQNRNPGS
jgi:hypothetical protein